MLLIINHHRFGPALQFSCMKYERFHQIIKGFTKNSNFINICKTIAKKYVARLELENSGAFEFHSHPLEQILDVEVIYGAENKIKAILCNRYEVRNSVETYLFTKTRKLINVLDVTVESDKKILVYGNELVGISKHNELCAYSFTNIEPLDTPLRIDEFIIQVGHLYEFNEVKYVLFNHCFLFE